jgi:hypothetical protein
MLYSAAELAVLVSGVFREHHFFIQKKVVKTIPRPRHEY